MAGNTFGRIFRVTTWGESHGPALGAVIDGCPPRLPLTPPTSTTVLARRRPGVQAHATRRREPDRVEILSGVFEGRTTGTPISLVILQPGRQQPGLRPLKEIFRPGHGDFTYQAKYGIRDHRGGGRASARETVARVAAAAVAQKVLDPDTSPSLAYTAGTGRYPGRQGGGGHYLGKPFLLPGPRGSGRHGRPGGGGQGPGGFPGGPGAGAGPGLPRRPGRAGLRQAGRGPGPGGDVRGRGERRGDRRRFRGSPHAWARSTTIP